MPRNRRSSYQADPYHTISRGNNRKKIFRFADDYLTSTETVASQKSTAILPVRVRPQIEALLSVARG
jgi:REP element-mobilizing transposase RayT